MFFNDQELLYKAKLYPYNYFTFNIVCFMSFSIFHSLPCASWVPHRTSSKNYYITCTFLGLFFFLHFEALNEPRQETKIVKYRGVKEQ